MTRVLTLSVVVMALTAVASAQAPIIVPRPEPGVRGVPLELKSLKLDVEISKQVASVNTDIVFHNQHGRQIEGTFLFPLPEATAINDFAMYVDGRKLAGEILKKEQAREIYDGIVNRQRDPALLEYLGKD
ncbi:MAG TPA: VIT domain-containing protein, partial [Armatimonadota bacterium]|nr:VIT domain-containing protein [Armatimonadota bacterium]